MADQNPRAFRVGIAGPVGSGKTMLVDRLGKRLLRRHSLVVANDTLWRAATLVLYGVEPIFLRKTH